jgi:hypothetical protein
LAGREQELAQNGGLQIVMQPSAGWCNCLNKSHNAGLIGKIGLRKWLIGLKFSRDVGIAQAGAALDDARANCCTNDTVLFQDICQRVLPASGRQGHT